MQSYCTYIFANNTALEEELNILEFCSEMLHKLNISTLKDKQLTKRQLVYWKKHKLVLNLKEAVHVDQLRSSWQEEVEGEQLRTKMAQQDEQEKWQEEEPPGSLRWRSDFSLEP